ncbi:MAG: hypothetical protein ACNA78_06520 [Balneolaceae bacterium]
MKKTWFGLLMSVFVLSCGSEFQQPAFELGMNNPAETGTRYPALHAHKDGRITMSWLMSIEERLFAMQTTSYKDGRWTPVRTVQMADDFFVNWADFPSAVSYQDELVAAHWLKKIEGGPYAYDVQIAFPADERYWQDPITPHNDGTPTEHGFVSMQPLGPDRVLAVWLDGRHTHGRDHGDYENMDMAMTLRSAEISADGTIEHPREIDAAVCDCCQTDLILTENGALAVYRNRTEDEIRDISIARYDLDTRQWSDPVPVHNDGWQIMACPVNGPRIAADGDRVAVIWYTVADGDGRVLLARSADGGETFDEPIEIASQYTLGRVDLAMGREGVIHTSWMESTDEIGYIMTRRVMPDGTLDNPVLVGSTSSSRRSGFPRMARTGNELIFAWTQTDPFIRVRTARMELGE